MADGHVRAVRLAGALASAAGRHRPQAEAVARAIAAYDPTLVLLTGSGPMAELAEAAGLTVEREAEATGDLTGLVDAARRGSVATIHVTAAEAADVRRLLPR